MLLILTGLDLDKLPNSDFKGLYVSMLPGACWSVKVKEKKESELQKYVR